MRIALWSLKRMFLFLGERAIFRDEVSWCLQLILKWFSIDKTSWENKPSMMQRLVNLGYVVVHYALLATFLKPRHFWTSKETEMENFPRQWPLVAFTHVLLPSLTYNLMPSGLETCNSESSIVCKSRLVCLCRYTNKIHIKLQGQVWISVKGISFHYLCSPSKNIV